VIRYLYLARVKTPALRNCLERQSNTVAIEPSRQFKSSRESKLNSALILAKIRNLNSATAKNVQETQDQVMSMFGPNNKSKLN